MNIAQWVTVTMLSLSVVFITLAALNIRLTERILHEKPRDLLDRFAERINSLIPGS
jgi:hypothetical protein